MFCLLLWFFFFDIIDYIRTNCISTYRLSIVGLGGLLWMSLRRKCDGGEPILTHR